MPETLAVVVLLALGGVLAWRLRTRRRPLCKLTLREGAGPGLDFVIDVPVATIGSEEGQTVVVSDPKVSRQHAVIHHEGGRFVLRDRSKHGVRINGEPATEAELRSGDLIRLGDAVDLIFTRLAD